MQKHKKTLEQYMELGAKFRTFKTMASKLCVDASQFMSRDDWNRMQKAVEKIAAYASSIEDEMFREYPELSDEYVDVFYGATTNEPRGSVDANIVERAKKFCEQLF